jgi:hypothetical protein
MDTRLRDITKTGSAEDLKEALSNLEISLDTTAGKLFARKDIGNANGLYAGIGTTTARHLSILRENLEGPIEIAACVVRTVFEINITLRYCCLSAENMEAFIAQAFSDEISLWKSFKKLASGDPPQASVATLNSRIEVIREWLRRQNLPTSPDRRAVSEMANAVGLKKEYETMYNIYSKYVHASGWLVLRRKEVIDNDNFRSVMQLHTQLYAHDTLARLKEVL